MVYNKTFKKFIFEKNVKNKKCWELNFRRGVFYNIFRLGNFFTNKIFPQKKTSAVFFNQSLKYKTPKFTHDPWPPVLSVQIWPSLLKEKIWPPWFKIQEPIRSLHFKFGGFRLVQNPRANQNLPFQICRLLIGSKVKSYILHGSWLEHQPDSRVTRCN